MERDRGREVHRKKLTERHPLAGMQDRKIERAHPNVVFDRRVRGALARYGVDTKAIESVVGDIVRAADQRQRDIGALSGISPSQDDYEAQAAIGDPGTHKIWEV